MQDLNLRPPACEAGALPTELIVRARNPNYLRGAGQPLPHSTRPKRAREQPVDPRERRPVRSPRRLPGPFLKPLGASLSSVSVLSRARALD
jgi:hypothetical protein